MASDPGTVLPKEILWLLDAPMFIDEHQVEAFYDATLRPDYEYLKGTGIWDRPAPNLTHGGENGRS